MSPQKSIPKRFLFKEHVMYTFSTLSFILVLFVTLTRWVGGPNKILQICSSMWWIKIIWYWITYYIWFFFQRLAIICKTFNFFELKCCWYLLNGPLLKLPHVQNQFCSFITFLTYLYVIYLKTCLVYDFDDWSCGISWNFAIAVK